MSTIGVKEIQYPDGDSASPAVLVTGGKGIKQSLLWKDLKKVQIRNDK